MFRSVGSAEKTIGRLLLLLLMKAHPMCCSFLFFGLSGYCLPSGEVVILKLTIMKHEKHHHDGDAEHRGGSSKTSIWLFFGVGILILLLLVWLTIADFWGDTDVAAAITPLT